MTTNRPEIIIEGSLDGNIWRPYEFRWKPTDPTQSPRFAGPHMPRIDWQMWFEGLNYERYANHPFSLMLYHKYLEMISLGGSIEDFNDFRKVLGPTEYQNFIQASSQVRQRVLENYVPLLNAFNSRSLWFGNYWKLFRAPTHNYETIGGKIEDYHQNLIIYAYPYFIIPLQDER